MPLDMFIVEPRLWRPVPMGELLWMGRVAFISWPMSMLSMIALITLMPFLTPHLSLDLADSTDT